jgi:hypothetical protein
LRPPTPWSTASPVNRGAKYRLFPFYGNEPWHQELRREVTDCGCTLGTAFYRR